MQAVLVVDIDYSCGWDPKEMRNDPDKQKVAEELKKFLQEEREKRSIISFVTFLSTVSGQEFQLKMAPLKISSLLLHRNKCLICDRDDDRLAEFLEHRHGTEFEAAFVKNRCDSFTNRALGAYFHSKNVKEVMLAGCSTDACVLDTAIGATKAGFDVTLIEKCVYPPFNPDRLTKENWLKSVSSSPFVPRQVKIV